MRFRKILVTAFALVFIAALSGPADAKPPTKSCAVHADCGVAGEYCDAGKCDQLSPEESFLGVGLEAATAFPAYLYIDGALIGALPWEGIVAAGAHSIRVESQGMAPVAFQGTSTSSAVEYIPIRMEPLQASTSGPGPTDSSPEDTGGREVPGTLRLALGIGIGYGTAIGANNWKRPVITLAGGGSLGLRVLTKPVWIEIGVTATSTSLLIQNYGIDTNDNGFADRQMRWGDFFKLDLGLLFRLMFPVKRNFIYLGAELSPGAGISNHNYVYGDLAVSLSIFPHEMFEVFVNPIGVDFAQELATENASFMVSYRAMLGIAFRFPKRPLF